MAVRTSGELLTNIAVNLADNNSGAISAGDVRNNMADIVESMNSIIASGNTDTKFPFFNDVRLKHTPAQGGGRLHVESGILFPNCPNVGLRTVLQAEPWPGVANIPHGSLDGLSTGDPHLQYLPINGLRSMTGNLRLDNNWIGSSGVNGQGFKFEQGGASGVRILTSGTLVFGDNSIVKSGRGVAKAWISFDASGVASIPVVNSAYNITTLQDMGVGKFKVTFASGVLGSNNYVAVGSSNSRTSADNPEDFQENTVGMVSRTGTDPNRTLTFQVISDGVYVDAEINNLVVFENGPAVSSDSVNIT